MKLLGCSTSPRLKLLGFLMSPTKEVHNSPTNSANPRTMPVPSIGYSRPRWACVSNMEPKMPLQPNPPGRFHMSILIHLIPWALPLGTIPITIGLLPPTLQQLGANPLLLQTPCHLLLYQHVSHPGTQSGETLTDFHSTLLRSLRVPPLIPQNALCKHGLSGSS